MGSYSLLLPVVVVERIFVISMRTRTGYRYVRVRLESTRLLVLFCLSYVLFCMSYVI
jgi:hypothetical protein